MWNNAQKWTFLDLFMEIKACLSTSIKLARYVFFAYKNWDNYDLEKSDNNNYAIKVQDNDDDENMKKKFSDNLYKFYGIYN